ncbi:phosphohydrolase [Marinobacter sp. NP-6]|uniref:phosphohydrolase n=1 Tax=Marinobacter sp. NP-6 TaxID=2488666 RepID=UPI000FC9BA45|nr:phosphohydrolase [Marinobacter sp. NP-6]RUT76994.1 phosphohydrolase [Marinobacter sp. NP-6]
MPSNIDNDISRSKRKPVLAAILASIVTTLLLLFLFLASIVWIPEPVLLEFFGYERPLDLTYSAEADDSQMKQETNELSKNSTAISLKEYWGFQSSFYETVITILIAINGLIAAAAVLYIRGSSHEKAESAANEYLEGPLFKYILNDSVSSQWKEQLHSAQADINNIIKDLELYPETIEILRTNYERLQTENKELKQQIRVIAERIASSDTSDNEGSAFQIKGRE